MLLDAEESAVRRRRFSRDRATTVLQEAWCGDPPQVRAAMAAALGDFAVAAGIVGGVWSHLASGETAEALRKCRSEDEPRAPSLRLAEAEALIQAGAIVAGMRRLARLVASRDCPATVALARHCHRLGDHRRSVALAESMPGHAQLALTGAKSALLLNQEGRAERLLAPYLQGALSTPDALLAGAFATVGGSLLARRGQHRALLRYASALLDSADAPGDMAPSIARVAWSAGLGSRAWERYDPSRGPWGLAARLELAVLAGNVESAGRLMRESEALGGPSHAMLALLTGKSEQAGEFGNLLASAGLIHVWRTHPYRWRPWVRAFEAHAVEAGVELRVCDLAADEVPEENTLPDAVLDDGGLVGMVDPAPQARIRSPDHVGVWFEAPPCTGVGIGHDWPPEEAAHFEQAIGADRLAADPEQAAVWVASAETAMVHAESGRPMVVLAPPGDPFWAGPLPSMAWPTMEIVRADPSNGWQNAGQRVAELALAQLER